MDGPVCSTLLLAAIWVVESTLHGAVNDKDDAALKCSGLRLLNVPVERVPGFWYPQEYRSTNPFPQPSMCFGIMFSDLRYKASDQSFVASAYKDYGGSVISRYIEDVTFQISLREPEVRKHTGILAISEDLKIMVLGLCNGDEGPAEVFTVFRDQSPDMEQLERLVSVLDHSLALLRVRRNNTLCPLAWRSTPINDLCTQKHQ